MTKEALQEIVHKHLHRIAPEADLSTLDPDEDIRYLLDIDSMDFFRLMVAVSEETGKDIPEEKYAGLVTINKLLDFLAGG